MKKIAYSIVYLMVIIPCLMAQNRSTDIIEKLKEGNKRFVNNTRSYSNLNMERIQETSEKGQHPFATIITCSDSRVPVEHIFDVGIGDVFVIRVAGNVIDVDEAGSIEYGVDHLHTPVFIVLGHSSCGAVTAVTKDAELHGNIPKLVDNIQPAVDRAKSEHGETFSDELLEAAIKENVWQSIEDLLELSHTTLELVKNKQLLIIGAVYHIESGEVEWLGEHPDIESIINQH